MNKRFRIKYKFEIDTNNSEGWGRKDKLQYEGDGFSDDILMVSLIRNEDRPISLLPVTSRKSDGNSSISDNELYEIIVNLCDQLVFKQVNLSEDKENSIRSFLEESRNILLYEWSKNPNYKKFMNVDIDEWIKTESIDPECKVVH